MRNRQWSAACTVVVVVVVLVLITSLGAVAGCTPNTGGRERLNEGYRALEQQQYNEALAAAEDVLRAAPDGPGTAEALYLRGRAIEQRISTQQTLPQQAASDLQAARVAYIEALSRDPAPRLDAYIRASLANVAYFQDDYTTAVEQWSAAYPKLEEADSQAWVLYRIGLSQQRLGHFDEADHTFGLVRERYPDTVPAQRAQERQGARSFYVQLATFGSAAGADRATNALRQEGVLPVRLTDAQGRHLLRVGPVPSYAQAKALKARFAANYPDAMIVP